MLVLAMEFSRGARCRLDTSTAGRSARAVDERERLSTSRKQRQTKSLPQNGTVRSDDHTNPVYGAGPGRSPERKRDGLGGRRACTSAE
jgi:hypothetical protein